jgi:nucleotide-binding universal stress UspA family protein
MGEQHMHSLVCGNRERIVVGVDRSADSVAALRWAAAQARLRRTHLHVVHAWQPPGSRSQAEDVLRDLLMEAFAALPAGLEQLTVQAGAAQALVAASHGAALLVLGPQVRGTFGEIFQSVSRRAAAFATCPVAAVRDGQEGAERRGRVVVGVDDSFTARDALSWAAAEAERRRARLTVVHAVVPMPRTAAWMQGEAREMISQLLSETLTGPLAEVPVTIDTRPANGRASGKGARSRASAALIGASERAALLVVGSHGYGSASGAITGSITSDCLRSAGCPVVIIPAAREDQHGRIRSARVAMER